MGKKGTHKNPRKKVQDADFLRGGAPSSESPKKITSTTAEYQKVLLAL